MTAIALPPHKPDWLRQWLTSIQQREHTVRHHIQYIEARIATPGHNVPAPMVLALRESRDDLQEAHDQLALLNAGWAALHPKPASPEANQQ